MVCDRCVMAVEGILTQLDIAYTHVSLGSAILSKDLPKGKTESLDNALKHVGFEIIKSERDDLVQQIKIALISLLDSPIPNSFKLSVYLSDSLNRNYQILASIFSDSESITIERYFILLKIEKVKELLSYRDLTLKEIAFRLNYSSTAHLSKQFKEVAGMTPSAFRQTASHDRLGLDDI